MKERAEKILKQHNCEFISMITECRVLWRNQSGTVMSDDIAVLANMSEDAWLFWSVV